MARWTRLVAAAMTAAVVGITMTACGGDPDPAQSSPAGGIKLRENIPTPVDDVTVIASNIWDDTIALSVSEPGERAETADLSVGDTATVNGREFTLVSIHEDDVLEIQHQGSARRFIGEQRG